jgi:ADP-heptose:LPS heptosyltransferase
LKDFGEIPGGENSLKPLLYPFHRVYPLKLWSKYRWLKNANLKNVIPILNKKNKWFTVIDRLGAPGDALITANVIRCIKEKHSHLKVNCITPHPELIQHDPSIDSINGKETFYSFDSTYWELIARKERKENIISHNLMRLGIKEYEYSSKFYLTETEKLWAEDQFSINPKPIIAICTRSKEPVKNWPVDYWVNLIKELTHQYTIIQLGDEKEPKLKNVVRFAGNITMRESAALLSISKLFIGPDSLLMHVANGLDVKSIILFGGSRPVECFGYNENTNLSSTPACSPCWIHDGYETCTHMMKCMNSISKENVLDAVSSILNIPSRKHLNN